MLKRTSLMFFVVLFIFTGNLCAQPWSGILNPSRAIDWSSAGVEGGIPTTWGNCTTSACNTLWNNGVDGTQVTAANIQAAINSASAQTVVRIPGNGTTRTMTTGIALKSNVILRGQGADQTILVFSGTSGIGNAGILIESGNGSDYFADPKMQPGGTNAATWTSGYSKGTTQIVLNNIGSNGITVGKYILLDQDSDTSTNNGYFLCVTGACSDEGGVGYSRVVNGVGRLPTQMVKVTACNPSCTNGATFTISPGVYTVNVDSSRTPGAYWPSSTISYAGVENLSLNTSGVGVKTISFFNSVNCWVKGVRAIRNLGRAQIQLNEASHCTIQDSYFYGGVIGHSENYCIDMLMASDCLIMNNIAQYEVVPFLISTATGNVFAYNYSIYNAFDGNMSPIIGGHTGGNVYNLIEGNIGPKTGSDNTHGNGAMNTAFRNRFLGTDTGPGASNGATNAIYFYYFNRYWNIVGNVLGTYGYHNNYANGNNNSIYWFDSSDSQIASSVMRWGNYDTVNAAVRWNTSEDGHTAVTYPALSNASQTLPASFYYSSKPDWWPYAKAWPPIGPDVTGGNVANVGGHAYTIPAQDCYANIMEGPADGTGPVLSFNASACYGYDNRPAPPTNLRVQ